jgi:hypothetical protein
MSKRFKFKELSVQTGEHATQSDRESLDILIRDFVTEESVQYQFTISRVHGYDGLSGKNILVATIYYWK